MRSGNQHALRIAGRSTAITVEPAFWAALAFIADRRGQSINSLIAEIADRQRALLGATSLSAAVRLWLFEQAWGGGLDGDPVPSGIFWQSTESMEVG